MNLIIVIVIGIIIAALAFLILNTQTQKKEPSLYDRLGGIYPIAAVVNRFSDEIIENPIVGRDSPNPQLRNWSRNQLDRLPGLKFMRTLWVSDITGGPYKFHSSLKGKNGNGSLNLKKPHCPFKITSSEFDEVASELAKALDFYDVPLKEKNEVLAAFANHKSEVIACT